MSDPNNRLMTVEERKSFAATIPAGSIVEFICGLPGPDFDCGLFIGKVTQEGELVIRSSLLVSSARIWHRPFIYRGLPSIWVKRHPPEGRQPREEWDKLVAMQAERERLGWRD